ncbi:hypothetical protein HU200_002478 [Digitaria exilis]|uniref:BSD domain-containing protein n=1 Tax=Digitaria exilis TaxID=1010633 RepID=A0A835FVM7_9POAL|nr:hypothetical protein HU200_002478 [Digitaria exilis]
MAWLARSIANSLLSPEEEEPSSSGPGPSASPGSSSPPRGVREDLSELTGALANRFQGLASFLAPAANPGEGAPRRPDPAEIAGRFRAGLARLPGRQAVADLAKIASSLLPPEGDADWAEAAAGVTEEVVAFARGAALRPELWLDFPLLPDDADSDDFDMTDAQQDHALAVESVAPELADLRIELCPSHMSESCFWKIYFVLLHPKLGKEDAEILSTPQLNINNVHDALASPVEVLDEAKGQDGSVMATSFSNIDYGILQANSQEILSTEAISDAASCFLQINQQQCTVQASAAIERQNTYHDEDEDDGDEWLEEETGGPESTTIPIVDDEDVSFSDLEKITKVRHDITSRGLIILLIRAAIPLYGQMQ